MDRIRALLEWLESDPAQCIDEALSVLALRAIDLDDALDGRRDLHLRDGWSDHFTECGKAVHRATERDLIPLLAVLIHPENADVPDVVVSASVHTTGHLDLDLAQIVQVVEIIEALLDLA